MVLTSGKREGEGKFPPLALRVRVIQKRNEEKRENERERRKR